MHIELDRTGTVGVFEKLLKGLSGRADVNGVLVLACDANGFTSENIDPILQSCSVPVVGGVFPAILHIQEKIERGTILVGLSETPSVILFKGMSDSSADYNRLLERELSEIDVTDTIITLVDGLASRISSFMNAMFINLGLEKNIIGGGAGSLSLDKKPNLLSNEGMLEDAAVLIFIKSRSSISISHGWTPIKGPFKVTESDRNVIKSLDWMPAFNIYREVIRSHSGQYLTKDNFPTLSMSYPFGIARICCEHIVRDPVKMDEDGNLICVGEVREGSFIDILHGSSDSLIEASRSISIIPGTISMTSNSMALMVDCISRALFMEDKFEDELRAIMLPDVPLVGMLSFGEIATKGNESLEFHNKTTVLSILEEL